MRSVKIKTEKEDLKQICGFCRGIDEVRQMEMIKVLVVDDEARMRKLVKDFLSVKGYQVLEAADGEEAIDIFLSRRILPLFCLM